MKESKKDNRTQIMESVVRALRQRQSVFEVFSDEEFYNSPYGEKRRASGKKGGKLVYLHVLVPGKSKSLFELYFRDKDISFAVKKEIRDFNPEQSIIPCSLKPNDDFLDCHIVVRDDVERYGKAVEFSLELMNYAVTKYPEYDPNHTWSFGAGINVPLAPKKVITLADGSIHYVCGNCELEFKEAPRCPDCGQLVKTPED